MPDDNIDVGKRWLFALLCLALAGCRYTTDLINTDPSPETTKVFYADGTELANLYALENREEVKLSQVAKSAQDAVIAIEDARFFDHEGIDPRALLRALKRDTEAGESVQGASTITQQYVRNVILDDKEKTVSRKVREAVLAVQFERQYTKKQILEKYLNVVYFGNGAYGIEAASQTYFNIPAKELKPFQAALLAGLLQSPETYDPWDQPDAATERRNAVLQKMRSEGFIDDNGFAEAQGSSLGLATEQPPTSQYPAGHFVEQVRDFILTRKEFGRTREERQRALLEGGLRIETTLDPRMQRAAEDAIAGVLNQPNDPSAALVTLDPSNGYVRAYVGGRDFFGSDKQAKFDLAGQGKRQAGSAFKPFVLATALESDFSLDRRYSAPGTITIPLEGLPPWTVRNYDGSASGVINLVQATVSSVNTVYAQLIMDLGAGKVVDTAKKFGFSTELLAVPSAALGTNVVTPLDMASAYGVFAADGLRAKPIFVTRVTKADGTILYESSLSRTRALPPNTAREVTGVLEQVIQRGTGTRANIGRPAAGKTGTSEEWSDAWFSGYTPELSTTVWVGFPDAARSMTPPATRITVAGGTWPAQIWRDFMSVATAGTPLSSFPAPDPALEEPVKPPEEIPIPSVVGLTTQQATTRLQTAGFRVTFSQQSSKTVAANLVISQTPGEGAYRIPGTEVRLTVSTGPPAKVTVPNTLGLLADQAANGLTKAGLNPVIAVQAEQSPLDAARSGRVWAQSIPAGQAAEIGSTITIYVNP